MRRNPFRPFIVKAAMIGALAGAALFAYGPVRATEEAVVIPPPATDESAANGLETVVVAGGCFWGVQGVFQHTAGVASAVSGYYSGSMATADYNMVSMGTTGHAEAVEIKFYPQMGGGGGGRRGGGAGGRGPT